MAERPSAWSIQGGHLLARVHSPFYQSATSARPLINSVLITSAPLFIIGTPADSGWSRGASDRDWRRRRDWCVPSSARTHAALESQTRPHGPARSLHILPRFFSLIATVVICACFCSGSALVGEVGASYEGSIGGALAVAGFGLMAWEPLGLVAERLGRCAEMTRHELEPRASRNDRCSDSSCQPILSRDLSVTPVPLRLWRSAAQATQRGPRSCGQGILPGEEGTALSEAGGDNSGRNLPRRARLWGGRI